MSADKILGEQPLIAFRNDLVIPVIDPTLAKNFRNRTVRGSDLPTNSAAGLGDGSVENTKLANVPALTLKGRIDGTSGQVSDVPVANIPLSSAAIAADQALSSALTAGLLNKLDKTGGAVEGPITFDGPPTAANHYANKEYIDGLAVNLGRRARARAATTANITIATALNNGDALDGVTLATDDLVLVKNQTAPAQNGIYVVGATPARFSEFDTFDEHPGSLVAVVEGTVNEGTVWLCTANAGGTLGTTAITFDPSGTAGGLVAANNLSDVSSPATARSNLGAVAASGGTLTSGTLANVTTFGGASNTTLVTTTSNVIDIAVNNKTTITADATFTISGTPADTRQFIWRLTNNVASASVVTFSGFTPYSAAVNAAISTFTIAANDIRTIGFSMEGTRLTIYGEQDGLATDDTKLVKDFSTLTLINRNLRKDDILPFISGIDSVDTWNKKLQSVDLWHYTHGIPHGLTGDGTANDTSAFTDLYSLIESECASEGDEARGVIYLPANPLADNGAGKFVSGSYMIDKMEWGMRMSLKAQQKGKAYLKQRSSQAAWGDGTRAFIRLLAECKGEKNSDSHNPIFENVVIDGNRTGQATNAVNWCVYVEDADNDADFAYWQGVSSSVKGYSGGQFINCVLWNGLGGIYVGGNRQRFRWEGSTSYNHGRMSGSTVTVAAECMVVLGNDPEIISPQLGSGTSNSFRCTGGVSGIHITAPNIWSPIPAAITDTNGYAIKLVRPNGAAIIGGSVNGRILIDGGSGTGPWRPIHISGVSLRPLDEQLSANGVCTGTVTDPFNAHVTVIGGHKAVYVESAFMPSSPDGWTFKYNVSAQGGSVVKASLIEMTDVPTFATARKYEDTASDHVYLDAVDGEGGREIEGRVVFPERAVDLPTPIAGLRRLRIDASRGMRGNVTIAINAGQLTIGASTLTCNLASNHDSYTGAEWFVFSQEDNTATALDLATAGYGVITRVDADTFTIPRVRGSATGTNTSKFWAICMQRKTHQSPDLAFDHWTNHLMTDFANFSAGSNSTAGLALANDLAKDYVDSFDVLDVTFGTGNDILKSINDAESIQTMLDRVIPRIRDYCGYWISRGKLIIFNGIPPNDTSSGATTAYGIAMDEALRALAQQEFQGKVFYVPMLALLLLPGSNLKDPATGNVGSGVHDNEAGAYVCGYNKAEMWKSVCPVPPGPPLIYSSDDRYGQSSLSYQIIDAPYAGLTKAASGLDTEFSGTCMEEYDNASNVTTGGGACTIVAAVVDEPDGYGKMQTFDFTIPSGGNVASIIFSGKAGTDLIFDRLVAGAEYEGWMRHYVEPSQAALLDTYEVKFMGVVSGNTVVLCSAVENAGVFPDDVQAHPRELVLKFPRFTVPASGLTAAYIETKYDFNSGQTGTCRVEHSRWAFRRIRSV